MTDTVEKEIAEAKAEVKPEEKKEESAEDKIKKLETELNAVNSNFNTVFKMLMESYNILTDLGHNSIQNGAVAQGFTNKYKQLYAAFVSQFINKQQQQQK